MASNHGPVFSTLGPLFFITQNQSIMKFAIFGSRVKTHDLDIKSKKIKQFLFMMNVTYHVDPFDRTFLFDYHEITFAFKLNIGFDRFIFAMMKKQYKQGYVKGMSDAANITKCQFDTLDFRLKECSETFKPRYKSFKVN